MTKSIDIKKGARLLIVLLSALFLLSACSDSSGSIDNKAMTRDEAETAAAAQQAECWQRDVLNPIYDTMGSTVMKMHKLLTDGAFSLMMICFAIWIMLRLLKFLSSVTEENAAQIWNEIIKKAFICLLCAFLASSPGAILYVINLLIFPLYDAFLEFGSEVLSLSSDSVTAIQIMGESVEIKPEYTLSCKLAGSSTATIDGFPSSARDMMGCMVCAVSARIWLGTKIALIVMTDGGALPFVIGLIMWGSFTVVYLGFVFYLVDTLFRFAMMILLLPIFIMAYAFGPTKKWTNVGFTNIMNSAAFMMAFSIIVAMTLMAMIELINANPKIFDPENPELHFKDFSIAMMCLLLIAFLIVGSLKISQQLSSAIIGGSPDAKFQQNLKAVGQMVVGWFTGGAGWALKKAGFFEKTKMGRAWKSAGALKKRVQKMAGRKTDDD